MRDLNHEHRIRQCTNSNDLNGVSCSLHNGTEAFTVDRDTSGSKSATMNMVACGYAATCYQPTRTAIRRPLSLYRNYSAQEEIVANTVNI